MSTLTKNWKGMKSVDLKELLMVGAGGLEPPTSTVSR